MYLATYIVLIQVYAEVLYAFPTMGDRVMLFEDSHEVLHMFLALIFYAKIINT